MMTTYAELRAFMAATRAWKQRALKNGGGDTKFNYALTKMVKRASVLLEQCAEQIEDISIQHCEVDADGIIRRAEDKSYCFTKDGLAKANLAVRTLNQTPVEIEPFITSAPHDLTVDERDAFIGFVLPDTD